MTKMISIAMTAGLLAIVSPAAAATPAKDAPKATKKAGEKRYCLSYDGVTGSRLNQKECKTKAQWAREGVEVGAPARS